ncbi:MAG: hypothetical protein LBT00_15760 [Spirochaetaceae bacterium]|nr:hypothetical protein [Spirochaetaceae bacterium]
MARTDRRGEVVIARSGATKQSRQRSPSHWIASPALTSGGLAMTGVGARYASFILHLPFSIPRRGNGLPYFRYAVFAIGSLSRNTPSRT